MSPRNSFQRNLNKRMGDAHEEFLAEQFGGRMSRGSGNQWRDPMDGRHNRYVEPFAFAWDGKSTLGLGIAVTRNMWAKAVEQAEGERPMLGLRFYENGELEVGHDLVVMDAHDAIELREAAVKWAEYEAARKAV